MRITEGMITRGLLESLQSSRTSMNTQQISIATGKKFQKASDDPASFIKASRFKDAIAKNDQYLANITDAKGWLDNSTKVLDRINEGVLKVKDLAVSGADYNASQEIRDSIADQVEDILEETIALANSTYSGKYVFGGTITRGDKPFSFDGATLNYSGNDESISRRIAEGYDISINVTGAELVSKDLFSSLIDLRDQLRIGDSAGISNSLDAIDTVSDNILTVSSGMGSLYTQVEMTESRIENANTNLSSYLSQTQDADMIEAITQYNAEEVAYKAALQTTSDAINLNILNFLR